MKIDHVFFGPYLSFLDSTPHALLRIKFLCPSVRTSLSSSCVQHACFVVICCLLWTVPRFLHISFSGCLRIVSPIHGTLPPKSFSFAVLRMSFTVLSVSPVHGTLPPDRLLLASTLLLLHLLRGSPDPIYIYVYAKILIRMMRTGSVDLSLFCLSCFVVEFIISANYNFVNTFFDIFIKNIELS